MNRILIVDDDEAIAWALSRALAGPGRETVSVASAEEALERARRISFNLVFLDIRLPGQDGLAVLQALRSLTGGAPVVVMTGHGTLQTAVRAVEEGAFDYLSKPFDLDVALACAGRALSRAPAAEANRQPAGVSDAPELTGSSPAMQEVFKRVALATGSAATVLVTGESGTGKELVARAIHRHGPRAAEPFVPVHVAALNPGILESELFGHERGAFTGATQSAPGLLALAGKGTIFLDEVAEIPPSAQLKLLRVLEQGAWNPVGSAREQRLEARVVAATHQNLERLCAEGRFRQDLYFRLNVFGIHLPPLRDLKEDIGALAAAIVRRLDPRCLPVPAETLAALGARAWAGNIRELRNALEHAAILARGGPVLPEHLPPPSRRDAAPPDELREAIGRWLDDAIGHGDDPRDLWERFTGIAEPAIIDDVLRRTGGNRLKAAQWLGMNRSTLRRKMSDGAE
ncbi:MAG: sigma-54-dependent transcriptional regulator [Planctomycetota bacterium]